MLSKKISLMFIPLNVFVFKEFKDLWPKLAVVVDGGPIADQSRLGSTVVDLSVPGRYCIIRPGW